MLGLSGGGTEGTTHVEQGRRVNDRTKARNSAKKDHLQSRWNDIPFECRFIKKCRRQLHSSLDMQKNERISVEIHIKQQKLHIYSVSKSQLEMASLP